ncbi:MAG: penicillinase repressor [Ponticaulis sp.]|nr:penicillinase repressor [Ponticaulis sp.]
MKDTELKLGDLEVATLEAVWSAGALDARQLHARIGAQRGISLQTVQSTLERLFKKSVLVREKVSHAYVYSPRLSREEVMAKLVSDTLSRFGDNRADGLLAAFSGLTETADEDVLATLEAMITERKAKRVDGGAA